MKRRTTILGVCAVISLGAAGLAAAHSRPPVHVGKPSVTPPPWSPGGDLGHGEGHGKGHGKGHGHGHGHGHGNES
jgi:hypothetical protein